ncbi:MULTISPECIES: hemolysin family protein [Vibrio harveyi group]|uniref:hemolysin family protein n=1 Tax=Vibrio harveyi group TaxID=717610 RepID=UPI00080F543A|nr:MULTISPECIES: hemolysin family protein [Vibrio diabolicus subgroup]EHR5764576.1 HlyC/CorC family transporter [Vibrio parahaemolyticus]EHY0932402.1 HlyC/CorC family transporter [Vibrio parahaemolyticus]EIZ0312332.1 HlyC/CorC family transporter [Vibrio parahaemolyticus]EJE8515957.1 HlyC/CorC family transporter [Vibrio parahaemolyticus]EJE8774753.1 HlyC/CorC family transporter [Vibrio parahaemolyticus]
MTEPLMVTLVTTALIVLSGFFVVIEFALMGARRHRLEEKAVESASARAALRSMNNLTLMLAGAQLGITFCTFALGAVTKPAVDYWVGPIFASMGMPEWAVDGASFGFALFVVTFLHLVVGEMAPKSWAIAHPEKSALAIALPARAYVWPLRPLLNWINNLANRLVKASGVEPVESAAVGGQDINTIRQLVEHSGKVGTLQPSIQKQLSGLIDLSSIPVETLVKEGQVMAHVNKHATVAEVRKVSMESGHMRILVFGNHGLKPLVVHVRDTLLEPADRPAHEVARKAYVLEAKTPVYEALAGMRKASVQLAVVSKDDEMIGVVTLADILRRVMPTTNEHLIAQ